MSRLIDILQRVDQAAAQPIGFRRTGQETAARRILLIASMKPGTTDKPADYAEAADALLISLAQSKLAATTLQTMVRPLKDIPWGVYLEDGDDKKTATLITAGCDFVVFPAASPISTTPQDTKVGKILQVESSMDDSLLRAISNLPIDAVLVTDTLEESGLLLWHQLMIYQHLTNLINKPLLASVPLNITESELKALWEAGVDGVVVEAKTGKPESLKTLRQTINKLPPRSARRRGKNEALLPYPSVAKAEEPEEEEEEEEYE